MALTFFFYMLGCSWTLLATILFLDSSNKSITDSKELLKILLLWPIVWSLGLVLILSVAVGKSIEVTEDTFSDIKYKRYKRKNK